MKNFIIVFALIISTTAFSQSKKDILTKKWKIDQVEEFGQKFSPMDNQKNDWINFTSNGKFTAIIESNHVQGTWSTNGVKVVVSVNKNLSKTKINWTKVKSVSKVNFALEYQNSDLITATLHFIPNK